MLIEFIRIDIPDNDADRWPYSVPAIADIGRRDFNLTAPITVIVGENGSGKSTLIEAVAETHGLDVRGGHSHRKYNNAPERSELSTRLSLRGPKYSRNTTAFFLRAETAMGVLETMSQRRVRGYGPLDLAKVSHGESFLEVAQAGFPGKGLLILDEPEAGLSFTSQLAFAIALADAADSGSQVLLATHSPLLMSIPGAVLVELSDTGFQHAAPQDTHTFRQWSALLRDPEAFMQRALTQ